MVSQFKRLSPVALCALIAALGGLIGGTTAVHGLRQNAYGPVGAPTLFSSGTDSSPASYESSDGGYGDTRSASCDGCSERDLGYRWAMLASVRTPDQCPNDSWGFRRGCLDYTGGI